MTDQIIFEPFVRFVIGFHRDLSRYGFILKNEFPKVSDLELQELALLEESFLIKIIAEWESFVHNIISYCIAMDTKAISKYLELELPQKISFDNAHAILNGLQYKTITGPNELKSLAKKVTTDKFNPFFQFPQATLNYIDDLYSLRNFIAHKSQRSKDRLSTMYKNRYHKEGFVAPGLFLMEPDIGNSNIIRRDFLYGTLLMIAVEIWKFLDINSYNFTYEDDTTHEGLHKGSAKMQSIFTHFVKAGLVD